jgi:uncharacterized protein YkwD
MTMMLRKGRSVGAVIVTFVVMGAGYVSTAALTVVDRPASVRMTAARDDLARLVVVPIDVRDLQASLDLINAERAAAGLRPVVGNAKVSAAAQAHSNDQAAMNTMSHTGSDGANAGTRLERQAFSWNAWGENVAAGFTSAPSVMQAWMNSPGHRATILGNYQYMGIAVAPASNGTLYWTLVAASGA